MPGPLASLRVLDFSTLLPGPYATMVLADLGAEVVRVEAPHRPDLMRLAPPYVGDLSAGHALVNRSKRSFALDLKHPEAPSIIKRLIHRYDIVIEGHRPGVMDRLGVGYEALSAEVSGLIYCAVTGYGQTGPYRDRAGHDLNYLALSGILSHVGRVETGPVPPGVQVADVGGGSLGSVIGILAAVVHRDLTGEGQRVDISMLDATVALDALAAAAALAGGKTPGYETEALNGGSFYDVYRTRDDRYLSVGSLEPKFWIGFCKAIGRPDLVDFGYNQDRKVQASLKAALRQAIAEKTLAEWTDVFRDLDVCVEPVLTVEETAEHPQIRARNMIVEVPCPDGTMHRQVGSPFRFSRTAPSYRHIGSPKGAHTEEVLAEAGFEADEIEKLAKAEAFG